MMISGSGGIYGGCACSDIVPCSSQKHILVTYGVHVPQFCVHEYSVYGIYEALI